MKAQPQHVADLFEPEPVQWGFRGDPYLWAEMTSVLAGTPLPPNEAQLDALLEDTFANLTGMRLDSPASSVFVERYSHGGMSSGRISFAFWRERGLPLLRSRFPVA